MSVATIPLVVFVLGGPGAGKGTQCENIIKVRSGIGRGKMQLKACISLGEIVCLLSN